MRTPEEARGEWARLKHENADLLGSVSARAVRIDLGDKGIYYRVEAGPFDNAAAAGRLCSELKRRGSGASLPDDAAVSSDRRPRAVVLGCAGERLTPEEARFFAAADPLGFVLFRRNCRSRDQVRTLLDDLRGCVGRADAPVLIDQEGGRVARLQPPEWRTYPAAAAIATLPDPLAVEAAGLAARLIAEDLAPLGITVDCAPVLDLPARNADPVIGDRAFGTEMGRVIRLGRAFCEGLLAGGVLPVIKHIPGHGRARVDSHRACPVVEVNRAVLSHSDFVPFRALSAMPWAMTAHIVFAAIDEAGPATFSRKVIDTIIRGEIGFGGVLISDDISMGALDGTLAERTCRALDAGCDLALHCSGILTEMAEIAECCPADFAGGPGPHRACRSAATARTAVIRFPLRSGTLYRTAGRPAAPAGRQRRAAGMNGNAHWAALLQEATTWVLPIIFAVTFHEAAHGFVAHRLGDDTAWRAGSGHLQPATAYRPVRHGAAARCAAGDLGLSFSATRSRCRSISAGCIIPAATWSWWRWPDR